MSRDLRHDDAGSENVNVPSRLLDGTFHSLIGYIALHSHPLDATLLLCQR